MTDILDQSLLAEHASALVTAARRAGADTADAVAVRGVSLSIGVRLGKVESTERAEGDSFGLRVFVGQRQAMVTANALDNPDDLAARAVAMARVAPEDRFAGLAPADRLATAIADLDLLDLSTPGTAELTERALATEAAALAVPGVSNSGGASASWSLGGLVLATSHGFSGSYLTSRHALSVSAVAGSGTTMERDWDGSYAIHAADLDAPEAIGRTAGERAVRRLNPRKVPSGPAQVVYDWRASGQLVSHLVGAISGASIARKTSFLKDRLGTQVFAPGIVISDDPNRRRGVASRPFDGEGVTAERLNLIDDGVLTSWILDSATARELGLQTNGRAGRGVGSPYPGTTNLALQPGKTSRADMIGAVKSGLYITDMIGSGVNGVTGDYSRGCSGFWIENGELTFPVSEITVAGNLKDMFLRLTPADDLTYRYGTNAPTVLIEGLTIAGD
ncbi:MAG: TldD/PmbA family protein [Ancalomicrobiaceae bacterium]|nr:TldD/PmbA family protein [Ancalomicrobiaceae bacterium]